MKPDGTFDTTAMWIIVDENGRYYSANKDRANSSPRPVMKYNQRIAMYCPADPTGVYITCKYEYDSNNNTWFWKREKANTNCTDDVPVLPTIDNEFLIKYE
jgi:hypothetical protein